MLYLPNHSVNVVQHQVNLFRFGVLRRYGRLATNRSSATILHRASSMVRPGFHFIKIATVLSLHLAKHLAEVVSVLAV